MAVGLLGKITLKRIQSRMESTINATAATIAPVVGGKITSIARNAMINVPGNIRYPNAFIISRKENYLFMLVIASSFSYFKTGGFCFSHLKSYGILQ